MRMDSTLILIIAGLVVAIICVVTPRLEVTLNDEGTDILTISVIGQTQPAMAKAPTQ